MQRLKACSEATYWGDEVFCKKGAFQWESQALRAFLTHWMAAGRDGEKVRWGGGKYHLQVHTGLHRKDLLHVREKRPTSCSVPSGLSICNTNRVLAGKEFFASLSFRIIRLGWELRGNTLITGMRAKPGILKLSFMKGPL